jgi:hypothetical protein
MPFQTRLPSGPCLECGRLSTTAYCEECLPSPGRPDHVRGRSNLGDSRWTSGEFIGAGKRAIDCGHRPSRTMSS